MEILCFSERKKFALYIPCKNLRNKFFASRDSNTIIFNPQQDLTMPCIEHAPCVRIPGCEKFVSQIIAWDI